MASHTGFIEHVCAQAGLGPALTYRRMFGEYALYLDGRVVALICDDQLFLKPSAAGEALLGRAPAHSPYPNAKAHFRLDAELDTPERLRELLLATAAALPLPPPKKPRRTRRSD